MRIIKSMEAVGPLVETIAALGIGLALLYVYTAGLSAARFIALIGGIFLLYEPIKTLSRMNIVMQRSIAATTGIFQYPRCRINGPRRPGRDRAPAFAGLARISKGDVSLRGRRSATRSRISTCASSRAKVTRWSARAARARAPFSRSSCAFTIRRRARCAWMGTTCAR